MLITPLECIVRQTIAAIEIFKNDGDPLVAMTLLSINCHAIPKLAKRLGIAHTSDDFFYGWSIKHSDGPKSFTGKVLSHFRASLTHPESPLWKSGMEFSFDEYDAILYAVVKDLMKIHLKMGIPPNPKVAEFFSWYVKKYNVAPEFSDLSINPMPRAEQELLPCP